jgi:hypothetical protein
LLAVDVVVDPMMVVVLAAKRHSTLKRKEACMVYVCVCVW